MHPVVVVLLDGLADRAHASLCGRTANEVADTPNLDGLVAAGSNGVLYSLGPGRAPSSELAHWAILGYRLDEFPGRAVFEAVGTGQQIDPGHAYAYAALRPAEEREGELWLTGRPRPGDEAHAERLVEACSGLVIDGLRFDLTHTRRGEAILSVEGADDRITDTDAFFRDRHPVLRPLPLVPEAERTARAVEQWTREVIDRLGDEPFRVITLKWWGRARPTPGFEQRHGLRGTFVAESPFLRGLAHWIGLNTVPEPETDNPAADLRRRFAHVDERLAAGDDFVFVHLKATDEAGHTKDPAVKRATIEALDAELAQASDLASRAVVCVTGDHATPTYPDVIHSGDPVPFVLAGPGVRADAVRSFGELECAAGILGHLRGEDVMPVLLNAADRPLFAGSRPTPYSGADGYPSLLEPLRIR